MAVEAFDKEERENPVRNFIAGSKNEDHRVKYVTAIEPNGKRVKLNADNSSDWQARGPGWRIEGPWRDPAAEAKAAAAAEAEEEDEGEEEDEEDTGDTGDTGAAPSTDKEDALEALNKLRAQATELDVKVNDLWGKKRLMKEIEAAKFRKQQAAG